MFCVSPLSIWHKTGTVRFRNVLIPDFSVDLEVKQRRANPKGFSFNTNTLRFFSPLCLPCLSLKYRQIKYKCVKLCHEKCVEISSKIKCIYKNCEETFLSNYLLNVIVMLLSYP